ncbi:MAG: S8 family serine peptidase, partial [candidate division Zixibacteria bacterium]|nr:S8 family serine peptidase [candidate division Zixibacteria bacterium]
CITVVSTETYSQDFYYCGDSTYEVTVSDTRITVQLDTSVAGFDAGQFLNDQSCLNAAIEPQELGRHCMTFALNAGCSYAAAVPDLLPDPFVARVFPVYDLVDEEADFSVTDLVSIQFDESLSQSACEDVLQSIGLYRVDSSHYRHNYWWCALEDTITSSPLHLGNQLHLYPEVEWASATMYTRPEFQSVPEDPYFEFQYYLKNTGQTGGLLDVDIDAELAWGISRGGAKVAILDDGLVEHPDLPSDRVQALWDFGQWNPNDGPPIGDPNATPGARSNHGVASAGIIGASHNGIGIAGICPNCNIMGIKIANDSANARINADPRALANAIHLAYALGADVISNSWTYNRRSPITEIYNAITYVTDPCRPSGGWRGGVAVIFSAGNYANKFFGPSQVAFPANMKETIAVGAIDKSNVRWEYSCTGGALDVVAPTGLDADPFTGIPRGDVWTDDQVGALGWNPHVTDAIGDAADIDYTFRMGGTSASCAMVSGITALLLSRRPDLLNGCAPYENIRTVLAGSAVDLGDPGKDDDHGSGRVNAYRALLSVVRGDINADGFIDAEDLNLLIAQLFFNGQPPVDERMSDVNCDGFFDAVDMNLLILHAFLGAPRPAPCFLY